MMTKEEHIEYWVDTAEYDWGGIEGDFEPKKYVHCLLWAHLTLEQLDKANWVKTHPDNIPPRVHNIVWLLNQSNIDLGEETMRFLENFNDFQLEGRYPDYTKKIYKRCTKEYTREQLDKVEEVRQCLLRML
jgi:HEPN domain-containing protein